MSLEFLPVPPNKDLLVIVSSVSNAGSQVRILSMKTFDCMQLGKFWGGKLECFGERSPSPVD